MRTAAELRSRREALGITRQDLADRVVSPKTGGTVDLRTVQRWEAGEWEAPETVWAAIEQLENWVEATVKAVVDGMFELHSKQGVSEGAELRRYRSKVQYEKLSDAAGVVPFEVHSHAVWESVKQLRALGVDTIVTY